jgi:hypothetical protein
VDFTLRRRGARVSLHVLRAAKDLEVRLDSRGSAAADGE